MAAISSTILQVCTAGDHVVASNSLYGGTFALFKVCGGERIDGVDGIEL